MNPIRICGKVIAITALTVGALGSAGCYGLLHPLQCDPVPAPVACTGPAGCREHFHVYAINGLDPMCFGNLCGLCDHVRDLGFPHVQMVQFWNTEAAHQEIVKIHKEDPEARFALWGYSLGANYVRKLANELNDDGVQVELLVYIGGDTIRDVPYTRPPNVHKIVNIMADGLIFMGRNMYWCGEDIQGAQNFRHKWVRHITIPSRKTTIEMIETAVIDACDHPLGSGPADPAPPAPTSARPVASVEPAVRVLHQVDQVRPKY